MKIIHNLHQFVLLLLLFTPTINTHAQEADLSEQLQQLQREIEAEQKTLQSIKQMHQKYLDASKAERQQLAKQLLKAELELIKGRKHLKQLQPEIETLQETVNSKERTVSNILSSTTSAAERAYIGINEIPATEQLVVDLKTAIANIHQSQDKYSDETLSFLTNVLTLLDQIHHRGTSVSVQEVQLHTASGNLEHVKLLAIGNVRFAYITLDGKRVGMALASPGVSQGYRWSETLPDEVIQSIKAAASSIESGSDRIISVPFDPTGRVQAKMVGKERTFLDRFNAGGPVMYPLAGLALISCLLILERLWVLYGRNRSGEGLTQSVLNACQSRNFEEAASRCKRGSGAVARVLDACLLRRTNGQRAMEDSIQEQLLQELPRLNRFMGGIAILASIAPLMGLLGTVTGIIQTFGVIQAFGNANPSLMAGGISEALVTTASGLIIAIPILIVHSLLRGRSERILADAERHAATLLTMLSHDVTPSEPEEGAA